MIDWEAAEDALVTIARNQILAFQDEVDCSDLYGLGFFADLLEGLQLVANFRDHHESNLLAYQAEWGPTDADVYRWEIGNWQYPAGLDVDNETFDAVWEPFREPLMEAVTAAESQAFEDRCVEHLENLCIRVLDRLESESVFAGLAALEGLTVLGHDDPAEVIIPKKQRLDWILHRPGNPGH